MPLIYLIKKKRWNSCLIPVVFLLILIQLYLELVEKKYLSRTFPWKKLFYLNMLFFFHQENRCDFPGKTKTNNPAFPQSFRYLSLYWHWTFSQKRILHSLGIFTTSKLTEHDREIFQCFCFLCHPLKTAKSSATLSMQTRELSPGGNKFPLPPAWFEFQLVKQN